MQTRISLGAKPATGKVSLERINRFLRESELLDEYTPKTFDGNDHSSETGHALAHRFLETEIGFRPARFTWTNDSTLDDRHFVLKIEQQLTFAENRLNVIYGPTASGKTSMLMALLGNVPAEDSYKNLVNTMFCR